MKLKYDVELARDLREWLRMNKDAQFYHEAVSVLSKAYDEELIMVGRDYSGIPRIETAQKITKKLFAELMFPKKKKGKDKTMECIGTYDPRV